MTNHETDITLAEILELERQATAIGSPWAAIFGVAVDYIDVLIDELGEANARIAHLESIKPDPTLSEQQDEILRRIAECNALVRRGH